MTADGNSVWADVEMRQLARPAADTTTIGIVVDVTLQRANTEELSRNARYDALTGLVNRRTLYEILDREIQRCERSGQRLALVEVDLDKFKEVNDSLGHETGDAILRAAGQRMCWALRRADVVGRLGGDEFGVVLSGFRDVPHLDLSLERLVDVLRQPNGSPGDEITISASLGVALYPEDGSTPDELTRAADHAMYAAKDLGSDTYAYYSEEMTAQADQRRSLRQDLGTAVRDRAFGCGSSPSWVRVRMR